MSISVVCTDLNNICGVTPSVFYNVLADVASFTHTKNSLDNIRSALKYAFETSDGVCVIYTKNSWSNIQKAMLMEFERSSIFVEDETPYVVAKGFKRLSDDIYFDTVYGKPFMFISNELKEHLNIKELIGFLNTDTFRIGIFDKQIESKYTVYSDEVETIMVANVSEFKRIKNTVEQNKIYTTTGEMPQEALFNVLREKNVTVSTAESCTAGLISSWMTDIPGASLYFMGGCATYSNEFKSKYLGVNSRTLQSVGAVSEEVSIQMAVGLLNNSKTDFSVAVTGIAGPFGGTKEKPVGLVYISVASRKNVATRKKMFKGNRRIIRHKTAKFALLFLREFILSQ